MTAAARTPEETLAMIEALRDEGLDDGEIAEELGWSHGRIVGSFERVQRAADPAAVAEAVAAGRKKAGPKKKQAVVLGPVEPKPSALENVLVAWAGTDERLSNLAERSIDGPGRIAAITVQGRQVSRAGLVRMLAEKMFELRSGKHVRDASEREQDALVAFAALAVRALESLEAQRR